MWMNQYTGQMTTCKAQRKVNGGIFMVELLNTWDTPEMRTAPLINQVPASAKTTSEMGHLL